MERVMNTVACFASFIGSNLDLGGPRRSRKGGCCVFLLPYPPPSVEILIVMASHSWCRSSG